MTRANDFYRHQLRSAQPAIAYLKGRGLTGEVAARFGLGYSPDEWDSLRQVFPDYENDVLVESGLVIEKSEEGGGHRKRYDRFRGRIMFPIRNTKGQVIGFGGRVMDGGEPKYLNSPETPLFQKGSELYGLFEARQAIREAGYVLVTEGYMDVVALAQLGFANAVATLGTACTPDHVQKLFRFTDSVVFSFDGDAAGRRAARKALDGALPYATDTRSIKFLFLPAEHDPDSYVREFGQEAFAEQIRQATPLSRFLIEAASVDCDLQSAEGRARLSSQARPLWQLLPEGAFKQQLLAELAQLIALDAAQLERLWGQQAASDHRHHAPTSAAPAASAVPADPNAAYGAAPARQWDRPLQKGSGKNGRWSERWKKDAVPAYTGPRTLPASRADHAARLLLANMALWEHLAGEDQAMLCALPAPHGPLFVWMESQFHEHGPLGWSTLQAHMQGQPFAEEAGRWMQQHALHAGTEGQAPDVQESRQELRQLLNLMLIDRLKQLETEALAQAQSGEDPEALQRYKSLYERRRELTGQL